MATLNISLSDEQKHWLVTRQETGGFASASDVVRDLIRERQEREDRELYEEFLELDKSGSNEPEPEAEILAMVKEVKRRLRETKGRA